MSGHEVLSVVYLLYVVDELTEAVGGEAADPGDENAEDDENDAGDQTANAADTDFGSRHVNGLGEAEEDDGEADENGADDADPAEDLREDLDLFADVLKHNYSLLQIINWRTAPRGTLPRLFAGVL